MNFQWGMATISFVADVIAIVGIPALAVSTAKLYKDAKKAREPQSVGHECLGFFDLDLEVGINLVPLASTPAIPRPGDIVSLPGEFHGNENPGAGTYKVESVHFIFCPAPREVDEPTPALFSRITINVRQITAGSGK